MQLPQPYLYTSPRMVAQVDQPYSAPAEGPVAYPTYGYHTLWVAEVPFIPAQVDKEGGDFGADASSRFKYVIQRQMRFLYSLAQLSSDLATFELRFVSWPQPNGLARVGIAFLGKAFHKDEQISRQSALGLWDKFSAVFPAEAPFSYPLVPVQHFDTTTPDQPRSFMHWHQPFPFNQLSSPHSIVELRKYEDWPTIREIGNVLHARDYIPHPFVAAIDYSAMSRLLETIARQPQMTIVAVTLRPQRLTPQEEIILHNLANWYQRAARGEIESVTEHPLLKRWSHIEGNSADAYRRPRAELGRKVYENLVHEMRSLFLVRLQVLGNPIAQDDVIEALGSEVMANADNPYPSRWSRVEATTPEELAWARSNVQWLEFARWGISPVVQQDRRIIRLRQLATVVEAAGAFRLPIAPTTGGMAGVDVRDEPFSLSPSSGLSSSNGTVVACTLGTAQDRGVTTSVPFSLPLGGQTELLQVFGDKSAAREQVIQRLFSSVAAKGAACILLKRGHMGKEVADLLHARYNVFDEGSTVPPFYPFLPPPGAPLIKFVDALLRVFLVAYELDSSVSAILRQALLASYEQHGWAEQPPRQPIDLAAIAAQIDNIARQMALPTEFTTMLSTRCTLPLRDLAITFPPVTSTSPGWVPADTEAIVIDVGWFGSDINTTLVYGCIWVWLSLALATPHTASPNIPSLFIVEDAHMLLAPIETSHSQHLSPSPLTSFIDSSTRAGISTVLIDDQPERIDEQIRRKARVTILTGSSNLSALETVGSSMGLSSRQQARLTRLNTVEAVVAVRGATPVIVTL